MEDLAEACIAGNLNSLVVLWVPILLDFGAVQRLNIKPGYDP